MGRSFTPKYRIEFKDNLSPRSGWMAWETHYGKPTQANLEKWRKAMNASFQKDGCNFHVSQSSGILVHYSSAKIVRQSDGQIMAETKMPMFEAI